MDPVDRANDEAQSALDDAIRAARAASGSVHQGTLDCDDCGEEIPLARRLAYPAAHRCIECQERRERATKRH